VAHLKIVRNVWCGCGMVSRIDLKHGEQNDAHGLVHVSQPERSVHWNFIVVVSLKKLSLLR
jgi:hypothetical protein